MSVIAPCALRGGGGAREGSNPSPSAFMVMKVEINEFAKMNYERSVRHDKNRSFDWEYYIKRGDFPMDKYPARRFAYRASYPILSEVVADETADIITYGFLLLSSIGIDAEKAIMDKYEEVNKRLEAGGFGKRA
ncbi:MAG: hypothetical protein QMD85_04260 [Candidatus Aenigmarchaeota archaeon]|nr:hypothetical protein [Candidatus Aenigmarchaeota archaeon]MDI6722785.1 hypothetical protein [Candidatus Aenigmarchaeota archaeon]